MPSTSGVAAGASTGLSTTKAIIPVTGVPTNGMLWRLVGKITSIASAPTTVEWYIARDAAGDHAVTALAETVIILGDTDATDGGVSEELGYRWETLDGGTAGSLWVVASLDTGTCDLLPEIVWSAP